MTGSVDKLTPQEQDERYLHLLPTIEAQAEQGYDPRLRFHVWPHGLGVRDKSLEYREKLLELGIPNVPSRFVTEVGPLLHDFNYLKYFQLLKQGMSTYRSAEELALVEGGQLLTAQGVDNITTLEIGDNVWGTKVGVRCRTWGRLILCAADLDNAGDDYESEFAPKTEDLLIEKEIIDEAPVDPNKFAIASLVVLARYHFENLWVPELLKYFQPIREFRAQMGRNLKRLALEQATIAGEETVNAFIQKLGDHVVRLCRPEQSEKE